MKTIKFDNMPGNYVTYFSGDVHIGTVAMSKTSIHNLVHVVKSVKNGYITFGGDQLESITVDDRRYSLDNTRGMNVRIDKQRDDFINMFDSLTGKVLWIMDGNHELRWGNVFRPNNDIAKKLGAEYANGVMIKAIFPQFRILDWHGAGSITSRAGDALQRKTNEMISLKRKLRLLGGSDDCEVVMMHHIHRIIVHPPMEVLHLVSNADKLKLTQSYTVPSRISIDEKLYRIPEEEKWYVSSGSLLRGYMEGYSTYVEQAGYAPAELGCIKITVKNDKLYKVEKYYL